MKTLKDVELMYLGFFNKNGRKYMENNIKLNELNYAVMLGEIGHPDSFDVSMTNVSHAISNFRIKDNILYGDVQILDTTSGDLLYELMKVIHYVFRPRGAGTVTDEGLIKNYEIYTFDAIPMSEDSFMTLTKMRNTKLKIIMDKIKSKNDNIL